LATASGGAGGGGGSSGKGGTAGKDTTSGGASGAKATGGTTSSSSGSSSSGGVTGSGGLASGGASSSAGGSSSSSVTDGSVGGSTGIDAGGTIPPVPARTKYWSEITADWVMQKWPDYRQAYYQAWSYVNGYVLFGFVLLYKSNQDPRLLAYMKKYIDSYVDANGNLSTDTGGSLDNTLTGISLVQLYELTNDERYHKAANKVWNGLNGYPTTADGGYWHNRGAKGDMWIDGIFMGGLFNGRYGSTFKVDAALDMAAKQIMVYDSHGKKAGSIPGMYFHGWDEDCDAGWVTDKTACTSPEVWSEGLGWYSLVVVETLGLLPKDHLRYAKVYAILQGLLEGFKATQDPKTGRWFDVVDKGDRTDNWTDSSGSSMFTYTIRRAIEMGVADPAIYAPIAEKGYQGIIQNATGDTGAQFQLASACDGVNIQNSYAAYIGYRRVNNAKEAVGGFLWATAIMEKPPKK
jgi:rhamnogalacturonyl hydrolase YesR